MTKLNWEKHHYEPDPARYQPPLSTGAMLPDDHEAKLESRRKAAKKRADKKKRLKRKTGVKADTAGWKAAGGGVMKRTMKASSSGKKTFR